MTVEYDHVPTQARHFHEARSFSAATVSDEISWGTRGPFQPWWMLWVIAHRSIAGTENGCLDSGEIEIRARHSKNTIPNRARTDETRDRSHPDSQRNHPSHQPSTSTAEPLLPPLGNVASSPLILKERPTIGGLFSGFAPSPQSDGR